LARVATDLLRISEAATLLGVTKNTLGRWHISGKFPADMVTPGGDRRWSRARIVEYRRAQGHEIASERRTIAYARVSTAEQKDDLSRQVEMLSSFCAARGWIAEIIRDTGSGMNYHKKGLRTLVRMLVDGDVERLVLTNKDRLLRFGAELVFALCEERGVEVVIINTDTSSETSFEEDLARDVLEIVTVFSARLYGARSRRNKKMLEAIRQAAELERSNP
jgi:excisionase family DNA binding protein